MIKNLLSLLTFAFISFTFSSCEESMAPESANGNIAFWTDTVPTNGIKIYIDGALQGELTTYLPLDRPGCGEQGTLTLALENGTYEYIAYQRDYFQWTGTVTVDKGGCTNLLLN